MDISLHLGVGSNVKARGANNSVLMLVCRYDEEDADISLQLGAGGNVEAERAAQREDVKRKLQQGGYSKTCFRVAAFIISRNINVVIEA